MAGNCRGDGSGGQAFARLVTRRLLLRQCRFERPVQNLVESAEGRGEVGLNLRSNAAAGVHMGELCGDERLDRRRPVARQLASLFAASGWNSRNLWL